MSTEIKMFKVRVASFSFIWELTGDSSRADTLPGSSEELLQRGWGGQYIYIWFGERGIPLSRRLLLITRIRILH